MIEQQKEVPVDKMVRAARSELEKMRRQAKLNPAIFMSNPALAMMLDLYIAEAEHSRFQTIYLIDAAGLTRGTGVRWINHLAESGLVRRIIYENDRRSKFVELTKAGRSTLEEYLITCCEVDART